MQPVIRQNVGQHDLAALNIHPAWPDAYQAMVGIALQKSKFEEATKFYRLNLSKAPQSLNAEEFSTTSVNNIGTSMAAKGLTDERIQSCECAL